MDPTNDSQSVAEQAADALVSQAQLQEQTSETTEAIREQSDALEDGTDTLDKFAAGGLFALASMGSLEGGVGQTARAVSTLFTETLKTTFKQINDSSALAQETLGSFRNLNTEIGGLSNTLIATGGELGTFAEKSFQMQKDFQMAQGGMGDAAVTFQNSLGQTTNAFNFLYKNIEDAEKDFVEFRSEVTEGNAILMNNLSSAAAMEMTILKRQLQLTGDETAELLETQYALTGEANADVAKSIVTTARSLELATGLPLNKLKEDIIGITTDLDTFGDIGVKSAGRLAAAIGQAGLDLQSFKGMTEQFMDFDNSAKKMGDLSAMFGIQMDAMEMTYLANEDQEEFLFRMREEILDAGLDVENMSKTRQRALADQLGMNVTQMQQFMREGELSVDQAGMEAATESAKSMDGLATAADKFGGELEGALRGSKEFEESLRMQLVYADGTARKIVEQRQSYENIPVETNTALKLSDQARENAMAQMRVETEVLASHVGSINVGIANFATNAGEMAANVAGATMSMVGITPGPDGTGNVKVTGQVKVATDEKGQQAITQVNNSASKQSERHAQIENRTIELADNQLSMQADVTSLVSAITQEKTMNVNHIINMNALSDKVIEVQEGKRGRFVFANADQG